MSNEIYNFDSNLTKSIKDRIKSQFVLLIPEEQWKGMIQQEINKFFQDNSVKQPWERRVHISDFGMLVQNELEKETLLRVKEYIKSSNFDLKYNELGQPFVENKVKEFFIDNANSTLSEIITEISMSMIREIASDTMRGLDKLKIKE